MFLSVKTIMFIDTSNFNILSLECKVIYQCLNFHKLSNLCFNNVHVLIYYQLVEEGAARSNPEVLVKQRRGRQNVRNSQQNINDDLSGMTSVVVTTSDVQHHDLNDENVVAVSGIPGNKYPNFITFKKLAKRDMYFLFFY